MTEEFDFEKELNNLEQNVLKLEQGNVTLEESVKLFKQGSIQTKVLKEYLDKIQKEIEEQVANLEKNQDIN